MPDASLENLMAHVTDGHPAAAARAARRQVAADRFGAAERVVLFALLRHAREKSLKARVFGDPSSVTGSNYPLTAGERAGN
jgi:hypothetical protein